MDNRPNRREEDAINAMPGLPPIVRKEAGEQPIDFAPLKVPEFRDSSPEQIQQAEQILREANIARKRENYVEAEAKCRQALELVPRDAIALEMLGDLLQGVARIDEALLAYKRALLADPSRAAAERKYGDLLVRQQNWDIEDEDALPKKPLVVTLLSCLLPGTGQILNGELRRGLILLGLSFALLTVVFRWDRIELPGSPHSARTTGKSVSHATKGLDMETVLPIFLYVLVVIYAAADANAVARRGSESKKPRTGWEV